MSAVAHCLLTSPLAACLLLPAAHPPQLCTLSAAGGELLSCVQSGEVPLFDVLLVDEAAQALEPATLIPLQLLKRGEAQHKALP